MKPSWLIGNVLKKCGVPCAYEIGMMLAKETDEPVVPDVPTASMYLYGTPSTSGNIGLRSGNSVTYYKGVVAPDINTVYTDEVEAKYPCAAITLGYPKPDFIELRVASAPAILSSTGNLIHTVYSDYKVHDWANWHETWGEGVEKTALSGTLWAGSEDLIWTNHDIKDKNGALQITKSADPIPVTGVVGYKYGDSDVLPDINTVYTEELKESHPYAAIGTSRVTQAYLLFLSTSALIGHTAYAPLIYFGCYDGETWTSQTEVIEGNRVLYDTAWANHDVFNADGNLRISASAPIPVYE